MVDIEALLYQYYIKYDRLNILVDDAYRNINANSAMIYIDLYNLVKSCYNSSTVMCDRFTLSSMIINLAAHYRLYFKRRGVATNIVLVLGDNTGATTNGRYYYNYNSNMRSLIVTMRDRGAIIEEACKLVDIICPYLPDVSFIRTPDETSVVINYLISKQIPNIPTIVITKDTYAYQLLSVNYNVTIFRPKKTKNGDESYLITRDNVFSVYGRERDYHRDISKYDAGLLPIFYMLTSLKERNVMMLTSVTKAIKIIDKALEDRAIINGHNSTVEYLYKYLTEEDISIDEFIKRYWAIDLMYQTIQLETMRIGEGDRLMNIVNTHLYDPSMVRQINDKYYTQHPLDLNAF